MGWRFRRSFKVAPGIRLNVSKRSVGASLGPRGAKLSANTRGEDRRTVGLPGTGLSHTWQSKLRRSSRELEEPPLATKPRSPRKLVGWTSLGVIVLLAVAGAPTVAGYLVIPAVVVTIAAPWIARRLR